MPTINPNMMKIKTRHEFHRAARLRNEMVRVDEEDEMNKKKGNPYVLALSKLVEFSLEDTVFGAGTDETGKAKVLNSNAKYYVQYAATLFKNDQQNQRTRRNEIQRGFFGRTCTS